MSRPLSILTIATFAALTLGGAVTASAQTSTPAKCGIETWSTAQMNYVTVPCTGGQEQTGQTASAPSGAKCGPEAWSTDKMAYVSVPCAAGTTDENPARCLEVAGRLTVDRLRLRLRSLGAAP